VRLIDADRLLKGYQDHEPVSSHIIWNSPTVEAIPIEWLMEWADNYAKNTSEKYKAYVIRVIEAIIDWRKESGAGE